MGCPGETSRVQRSNTGPGTASFDVEVHDLDAAVRDVEVDRPLCQWELLDVPTCDQGLLSHVLCVKDAQVTGASAAPESLY